MKKLYTITLAVLAAVAQTNAAEHQWQAMGTGTYTDDILSALFQNTGSETYSVSVEKDVANEGYYRIVDPLANYPYDISNFAPTDTEHRYIVINATNPANVIIEKSNFGFVHPSYKEEMFVYSYTAIEGQGSITSDMIDSNNLRGTLVDGIISFPGANSLWISTATADANDRGYYGNPNGAFKLLLPGAKDYSIELLGGSWCAYDGYAIVSAWTGADATRIVAGAVTDLEDEAQIKAILANPVELTPQQGAMVPVPTGLKPNQPVYIMALVLDAAGNIKNKAYNLVYAEDTSDNWTTMSGKAIFNDYIVKHAYNLYKSAYEVEIQQNNDRPGYYRLVDPYQDMTYNTLTPSVHGSHHHYLYIDATDPNCVILEEGPLGYITETDGDTRVKSRASDMLAAGFTKEQIKAQGYGGILKDGVIKWPFAAYVYIGFLVEGADYWMNVNFTSGASGYTDGPMYIDLSQAGIGDVAVDANDAPVEYYNLQGIRVEEPTPGQILIKRQGATTTKVRF